MNNNFIGDVWQDCTYESGIQRSNASKSGEIIAFIGTKADGELFFQNISPIPHFLVCGFSGAGKTSFVQTITTYLAVHYPPEEVNFIIYDSKKVDYTALNAMPHLAAPIITDDRKAMEAILWLSAEVEKRLKLLTKSATKDIVTYNKKCIASDNEKMHHVFMIFDDFSSLQLDNDATASLMSVLKNGRAVGIHLIFVTSLTSSKVLAKEIMSNVPCRISFCVSTKADSRTAIEQNGAENLGVPGELIFKWQNNLIKCQGAYIPNEDVQKTIKKIQRQNKNSINVLGNMAIQIFDNPSTELKVENTGKMLNEDELFSAAVDAVFEMGQASVPILQQKLKIGYARAARLVDAMEECGIVGPFECSKSHRILITKQHWQTIKNENRKQSGNAEAPESKYSTSANNVPPNVCDAEEDRSDIKMRDFAQFNFGDIGLCINNNQIKISNKIMTKYGPGTTTASFNGKSVAELIYRKPRIFSHGYIEFIMKPKTKIANDNSDLITIEKNNLPNILKIEFDRYVAHMVKTFMIQISQDINVQLNEL